MKSKTKNILLVGWMLVMVLFSLGLTANAASYSYSYETFSSPDSAGQNPYSATGELGYTFAEFGWSGGTSGVADSAYFINTSSSGADGWGNFTFNSSASYDYFEFQFEYLNDWTLWQNHSGLEFRLAGNSGDIIFIQIYGANTTVGGSANRVKVLDYAGTEVANVSIAKDTWYTVRLNPDYDSWDMDMAVTISTGGTNIVSETVGLNGNTALSKFYMCETPASGTVCIYVDSFVLLTTTLTQSETTTNYLAQYIFPLMFALAMMVVVITMVLSGNVTPELLITVMLIAIIGVIAISIIGSI